MSPSVPGILSAVSVVEAVGAVVVVVDMRVVLVADVVVSVPFALSSDSVETGALNLICSTIFTKTEEGVVFDDWIALVNDGVRTAKQLILFFCSGG